jgi:hypothetical protein
MVMDVEIELRIPTLMVKGEDDSPAKIDNTSVRFRKVIQVPAFSPPGSTLQLNTSSGFAFECTISRADWHDEKQLFVLTCRYPNKRIFQHEYEALLNDPEWRKTELPG